MKLTEHFPAAKRTQTFHDMPTIAEHLRSDGESLGTTGENEATTYATIETVNVPGCFWSRARRNIACVLKHSNRMSLSRSHAWIGG